MCMYAWAQLQSSLSLYIYMFVSQLYMYIYVYTHRIFVCIHSYMYTHIIISTISVYTYIEFGLKKLCRALRCMSSFMKWASECVRGVQWSWVFLCFGQLQNSSPFGTSCVYPPLQPEPKHMCVYIYMLIYVFLPEARQQNIGFKPRPF